MIDLPASVQAVPAIGWRGRVTAESRDLPEEVAIALTYGRVTFAVMIASPADLEDFAIGFSISEGIIERSTDIVGLEIVPLPSGVECRIGLTPVRRTALDARRRHIAGPAGCGLCGIDSITQALRPSKPVSGCLTLTPAQIVAAMASLPHLQPLNQHTHATHAASFYTPANGEHLVREDIGRHNALDKLIGAVHRRGDDPALGAVLLTSRVSIELVQKTASLGAGIIIAVSLPSALAVREAAAAGITLVAVARSDGFEVFTHPHRITGL